MDENMDAEEYVRERVRERTRRALAQLAAFYSGPGGMAAPREYPMRAEVWVIEGGKGRQPRCCACESVCRRPVAGGFEYDPAVCARDRGIRDALDSLVAEGEFEVVGTAPNGEAAYASRKDKEPRS